MTSTKHCIYKIIEQLIIAFCWEQEKVVVLINRVFVFKTKLRNGWVLFMRSPSKVLCSHFLCPGHTSLQKIAWVPGGKSLDTPNRVQNLVLRVWPKFMLPCEVIKKKSLLPPLTIFNSDRYFSFLKNRHLLLSSGSTVRPGKPVTADISLLFYVYEIVSVCVW